MDVEPAGALQGVTRHEQAIGDHDHGLDLWLEARVEPFGLPDRNPQPLGDLLCRRGSQSAATAAPAVRPCQQVVDLMPLGEAPEHVCPERRRRRHGDARH